MGLSDCDTGFQVQSARCKVQCGVKGAGYRVQDAGCRVPGTVYRVQGTGCGVRGAEFVV